MKVDVFFLKLNSEIEGVGGYHNVNIAPYQDVDDVFVAL
jgi:hypothetical protein